MTVSRSGAAVLLRKARDANDAVGVEEQLKRILQMRAAVSATATMRLPVAAKIVEQNRGTRTIVFHERVNSAKALFDVLQQKEPQRFPVPLESRTRSAAGQPEAVSQRRF